MATAAKRKLSGNPSQPASATNSNALGSFKLPLVLTLLLFAMSFTPRVQENEILVWSFWAAAAALLGWQIIVFLTARSRGETSVFDSLALAALCAGNGANQRVLILGILLATCLRSRLVNYFPTAVCLCVRHPAGVVKTAGLYARVWAVSHNPEY